MKILPLIALFPLCCSTCFGQESIREAWNEMTSLPEEEVYEIGSLYEAFLTNNSSWENGDVLIKTVTTLDTTGLEYPNIGDLVMETTELNRFRFDFQSNRFFCVRVVDQEIPLLVHPDIPDEKVVKRRRWVQGFAKINDKLHIRDIPRKVFRPEKKIPIKDLMKSFKIPELRTIGIVSLGASSDFSHLKKVIAKLSSGVGIVRANEIGQDTIRMVRRSAIPGNDKQVFVSTVDFDRDRFVPMSKKIEVEVIEEGKTKLNENSEEQFEWQEIEGIMVPKSVTKGFVTVKMIAGQRFVVEKSVEASIIWKDLNKEIPDSDFSHSLLNELDSMTKLTNEELFRSKILQNSGK